MLPALVVAGLGLGCSFVSLTLTAVAGVAGDEAGLASGLLATSQQLGGALGLAVLVTVSVDATNDRMSSGRPSASDVMGALSYGWARAFTVAVLFATASLVVVLATIRRPRSSDRHGARHA